jgi:hypothetical protein
MNLDAWAMKHHVGADAIAELRALFLADSADVAPVTLAITNPAAKRGSRT